jgi:uncharacterized protein (DUF302 family)
MSYYIAKMVDCNFEEAIEKTREALREVGFSVVTTIDIQTNLKNAIDKDMKPYMILGACNPHYASAVTEKEPRIGVLLPCNVVVRVDSSDKVEVVAVNTLVAMQSVNNPELEMLAKEVNDKLEKAILSL